MNTKTVLKQIGSLTGFMVAVWSFISGLSLGLMGFVDPAAFGPAKALEPLPGLFLCCLLNALVIVWFTSRSHHTGFKLGLVVFTIIFGVMFFMTQIETIYFNDSIQMPWQIIFSTVLTGVFVGLTVAIRAVRNQQQSESDPSESQPSHPLVFWKFTVLSVVYLVFYFFFGYYVAWQFPALREYYSGTTDILPFLVHMQGQVANNFDLILFQIVRGFLWAGIAYVVMVSASKARPWEQAVIVGLAVSVGLATPLFVPNEYMPATIRFGHFFELLIENFLFGVIAVLIFRSNSNTQRASSK